MENRIDKIKQEVIIDWWANVEKGMMFYNSKNYTYQFARVVNNKECNELQWEVSKLDRNDKNCPIITKGIIAFIINNFGKSEKTIFDYYFNSCLQNFKSIESKKPGSSLRDLESEFNQLHIQEELERIDYSRRLIPYLSNEEWELIQQYSQAYIQYISNQQKKESVHNNNQLSVPDWCIIFYYLDEAGTKEGYKIDRIEKFIQVNNVINPSGTHTTKTNFKKELHLIENRINCKNDKNPLPPERIEKILPHLKNNKKALQTAKSDIEHLTDEKEENKRNTY